MADDIKGHLLKIIIEKADDVERRKYVRFHSLYIAVRIMPASYLKALLSKAYRFMMRVGKAASQCCMASFLSKAPSHRRNKVLVKYASFDKYRRDADRRISWRYLASLHFWPIRAINVYLYSCRHLWKNIKI